MKVNKLVKLVSILSVSIFIQGCVDKNMSDLRTFVADAYKDKKPEIEPLPEIEPHKAFAYGAVDKSDPFLFGNIVSNRDDAEGDAGALASGVEKPKDDRIKEPLEEFPLDALSMVGTMSQKGVHWVVVRTNTGTAHRAQVGNYLGQNDGKITQILPGEQRIVLEETVQDPSGRWINRDLEITIDEQ